MKTPLYVLLSLLILFIIFLKPQTAFSLSKTEPLKEAISEVTDYSQKSSWLTTPGKIEHAVDVFYVYPTIYGDTSPKNMDISSADLRETAGHLLVSQAGVYSESANLFAPFYRQMSMAALDSSKDMFSNKYFRIGAEEVQRAFDYYLTHFNKDRPFILAGHSQGSMVLLDLLFQRFQNKDLQDRLVAAYIIGYSVTKENMEKYPHLALAQNSDDTGVIITYNTQAPGAAGSPVLLDGALCINPLNWKTDNSAADKSMNLGAVFFKQNSDTIDREVPQYTGAQIDTATGALNTNPPDTFEAEFFPEGVYHKYDYAFWYRNLQQNVKDRINAYLK